MRSIKFILACVAGLFASLSASTALAELVLTGLDQAQEANARALMPLANTTCESARWRVESLFRDADSRLRGALEALGYYNIKISKALEFDDECWRASFDVAVGDSVVLRNVAVEIIGAAAVDVEFASRIEVARPASGRVLNHGRYEQYKNSLLRTAIEFGYFDADFKQSEVTVDTTENAADIAIKFDSGERYRFGDLSFSQGILHDSLMRGYTDIQAGDFYDSRKINDLHDVLNGSTYFGAVTIRTEPLDRDAKTVPVNVSLQPGTRQIYSVGAGFATDTGPHGRLGYANRRRNDKGHQFEARLFGSPVKSELTTSYRWPRSDPRREWFNAVFGIQHEDTATSENDIYKVGIQRSRNLASDWLENRYVDYSFENFKVGDQDTSSRLVIFGTNWESTRGRQLSRVDNGLRLSFDVRGASDSLASDTTFLQFRFNSKWIHSFNGRFRVLARAAAGVTEKEVLTDLPVSVRLFAGGDQSVRGYDFKTLGPIDADGLVIGGSNLLEGSLEFDYLFRSQWALATFVDTGSAFNNSDVDFSTGVGLGLRWYSPVGPIRLDLAHPLDDPDQKVRVHISLGLDL